jgi:hypothetical protein
MPKPLLIPEGVKIRWIGPTPESIDDNLFKRLFGEKAAAIEEGTLVVAVISGEVGVKTDGGLLVLGEGETGFLNPFMEIAEQLPQVPWQDPTISPEDIDRLLEKTETDIEKALGIDEGGENCECEIVY